MAGKVPATGLPLASAGTVTRTASFLPSAMVMNCSGRLTASAYSAARLYSFQVLPALLVMAVLSLAVLPRVPRVVVCAVAVVPADSAIRAAAMVLRSAKWRLERVTGKVDVNMWCLLDDALGAWFCCEPDARRAGPTIQ